MSVGLVESDLIGIDRFVFMKDGGTRPPPVFICQDCYPRGPGSSRCCGNDLSMTGIRLKVQLVTDARGLELIICAPHATGIKERVVNALAVSGYPATSSYEVRAPLRTIVHARLANPLGVFPDPGRIRRVLHSLRIGLAAA